MLELLSFLFFPLTAAVLLRPDFFLSYYGFDADKYYAVFILLIIIESDMITMAFYCFFKKKIFEIRRSYKKFMKHLFIYSMLPFVIIGLVYFLWMFHATGRGFYFTLTAVFSLWLPGSYSKFEHYSYWGLNF